MDILLRLDKEELENKGLSNAILKELNDLKLKIKLSERDIFIERVKSMRMETPLPEGHGAVLEIKGMGYFHESKDYSEIITIDYIPIRVSKRTGRLISEKKNIKTYSFYLSIVTDRTFRERVAITQHEIGQCKIDVKNKEVIEEEYDSLTLTKFADFVLDNKEFFKYKG